MAQGAGVPVILDAGGADGPLSDHLLTLVTTFSPNETELARFTGMPTGSLEEVEAAARCCLKRVSFVRLALCLYGYQLSDFLLRLVFAGPRGGGGEAGGAGVPIGGTRQ